MRFPIGRVAATAIANPTRGKIGPFAIVERQTAFTVRGASAPRQHEDVK